MDWKAAFEADPRFAGVYARVRRRSAWPVLTALFCAGLVVVVPVVLALLAGLVVGLVVYVIASAAARVGNWFTGGNRDVETEVAFENPGAPDGDLRENVRVIQR
ncbi:MAG: hypothetical protein AAFX76_01425 [Planctomycetota bacterium]